MTNQELIKEIQKNSVQSPTPNFTRISIPLIKQIYPQLISGVICGVQPLGPSIYERILENKNKSRFRSIDDDWQVSKDEFT